MPNRLASATSPYLLQHADNPVDWWEWGPEAFDEARRRDVPVLVSIGYAACHWCHVMAHESFEDDRVAAYLNERFVAVKVDREERPDVDTVYMSATTALTGHGGWPMTVFVDHDGRPFYAGTYFPPEPRHGMPSFGQLLAAVHRTWVEGRDQVAEAADRITAALRDAPAGFEGLADGDLRAALDEAYASVRLGYDVAHGGFGRAPKFPPSMVLEWLLRLHARTGDPDALAMVAGTCEAMARGGMHDQLAGGFARYSVDERWVVPHFEKMLYDNALLLRVYLHWWRATGHPLAERVARSTADFLLRDLRTPEGGFASALDADTDGVEGLTYAWRPEELTEVLGEDDGRWAASLLRVTERGTFEHGRSVLQLLHDPDDEERWTRVRTTLLRARDRRPQPARDDKVVAAWNGLAVAALAEAGALLGEAAYTEAAVACAELIVGVHLVDGRLRRVSRDGVVGRPAGVLEDHGCVAEGLLALHQVTGETRWLEVARDLLEVARARFHDADGGFHDTADDAESLVLRPRDPSDNASPSGWSATAAALLTYAALTGSAPHRIAAEQSLAVLVGLGRAHPRFAGWALAAGEAWLDGPREVAVVGTTAARTDLERVARFTTAPGAVVVAGEPGSEHPLLTGRPATQGGAAAYVCRGFVCDAPTSDPGALAVLVGAGPPGANGADAST